jgi:hypothetical protein
MAENAMLDRSNRESSRRERLANLRERLAAQLAALRNAGADERQIQEAEHNLAAVDKLTAGDQVHERR